MQVSPPDTSDQTAEALPLAAVLSCPQVLTKRRDFIAASKARRQGTKGLMLQGRARGDDDPQIRVGFTCSKKVGNAVARNRAKRRLRAIAFEILPREAQSGWDYVLIGRHQATAQRDFTDLKSDLSYALTKVHG
ncbi:ribonuclease P protein component [Algirhabdus cladophorae]|uniref:ribonuclease P protein component n=1 Tax=Algirhabdus cladophorae TaxID=3377108 RepID=UPI003B847849